MINLSERSPEKELLDADNIPFADIQQNMRELNAINSKLGGHAITISAVKNLIIRNNLRDVSICEVGCGGGDNMTAISRWCEKRNIKTNFIGIDIKNECIAYAQQQYPDLPATWIASDYRNVTFTDKPTIIFSSLFCHHFTNAEIIRMLSWMETQSGAGFFINDLHRHPIAYHFIKKMTALFSRSYLVRNDAPLSVARGFKRSEWKSLLEQAGISKYSISWRWAFRHLIICNKYGSKDL